LAVVKTRLFITFFQVLLNTVK